ncbi:BA14K family protein [Bradyrhizobium sp. CCBAU 51627]|uniref:BA14K family protein n=1 Tax=Bradyrhizobium sp. CCBAU 51627 TaxID=1325088 RepID=UPI002305F875|nr:BA14K family protein [Bradyrhizobium sp. CCBAU 51627]MDA9431151.1 hypothetical protein [Bradyrhizobium sp. CCBAU 51627]
MHSLKVLSAAAALALALPLATPSFAQSRGGLVAGGGGGHFGGGGGGHFSGGGAQFGGGSFGVSRGSLTAPSAGATPTVSGTRSFATASSGSWNGRSWNGGTWNGGWRHHHHGGFWPGFAAGAAIGSLGSYAYYGGPYYDDSYYDDGYYDDGVAVAVVPDAGGDWSAYCAQRYRSYDPASGTYLGYDGLRHPCP